MAPEICNGRPYDTKVDIWALGILTYCLLSGGRFPFDDLKPQQLSYKIRVVQPNYGFVKKYGKPEVLKHFLQRCLEKNPEKRATAAELL